MVNFLYPRRRRRAQSLWLFAVAAQRGAGGGIAPQDPGFEHGGGIAMRRRLNAFFAFAVNTPSMSMVNFSCAAGSAWRPATNGMLRRITPHPAQAPERTEAGADARICPADNPAEIGRSTGAAACGRRLQRNGSD